MITLEHIGIPARDTRRLAEWYRDKLGFKIIFDSKTDPPVFFVQDGNGMAIEIVPPGPDGKVENAHSTHFALISEDYEKTIAELEQKGIEFEPEMDNPFFGGTRIRFFTDPEGHRHQVIWRKESLPR